MVEATWLGHAAWRFAGSRTVIVDPFLEENPAAPLKVKDLKKADVVLVSHDHFDHFADAPAVCKKTGAVLVATYEVASAAGEEHKIKTDGMNIGGTIEPVPGVKIHMTIAFHTSGRGHPTGWVIEMDGVKIYHTGDTCLFGDMKIIGEFFKPDLACIPIGDRFTMGPASAAKAVELIRPRTAIPMHYNTWPPIQQDPEKWKAMVGAAAEVVVLKPGETFTVKPR
jgi:L-ascorbate metabolism protein UlaG (beta-lactamase superfamily)